jgi:hypothetical protein
MYSDLNGGELLAVNSDGTEYWRSGKICNYEIDSSPCIGSDGTIYIGSANSLSRGYLHAFGEGTPNNPPGTPSISGPGSGKTGTEYDYSFSTTDPDDDPVYFLVDWGIGSNTGWLGPYDSGEEVTLSHSWSNTGTYSIRVKARDDWFYESDWETLEIIIPKSKDNNRLFVFV